MAKFKVFDDFSVSMTDLNLNALLVGDPTVAKKKLYVLDFGDGDKIELRGVDFKYNKQDAPVNGEVHSLSLYSGGDKAVSLSGFEVSMKTFLAAAKTQSERDDAALFSKILSKNDSISGGDSKDILFGGDGNDTIYGGGDADLLRGDKGADTFAFRSADDSNEAARDKIMDFNQSQHDKIDLSAIGDFDYIGKDDFSGDGPEVGYTNVGKKTYVNADVDGDGNLDLVILLQGKITLQESDFIL